MILACFATALSPHAVTQDVLRRVHDCPESKKPEGRKVLEAALDVTSALEGK
jgi:hypothetical protein